jgi:hypothetical protein
MRWFAVLVLALGLGVMGCSETSGTGGSAGEGGSGGGVGGAAGDGGGGVGGSPALCVDNVCACTEAGIRAAIAEGGGPFTFDCDGPTTVVPGALIDIENDVILDGEGNLTVESGDFRVDDRIVVELRGFAFTNKSCVANIDPGTLIIRNCTITASDCSAALAAGPVFNSGAMTLTDSTVSGNEGTGKSQLGGGISNIGWMSITNSTVSGNTEVISGGGIWNLGTMLITNSTVSGNTASNSGGGIDNDGEMSITNSTVSGNTASNGGGIRNIGGMRLTNTLVDNDCVGIAVSGGHNIESPGDTCGFDQPTDQVNVSSDDLKLGELADNGGPTMTHALGAGSVAIDVIPEAECVDAEGEALMTDQRGEPRDSMCDVGAFEVRP